MVSMAPGSTRRVGTLGRLRCRCGYKANRVEEKHAEIPLTGSKIEVELSDVFAKVTVQQRYENTTEDTLEVSYEYKLPPNAAVSSFHADVNGVIVKSQLKEKEDAQNTYDDALASGSGAFLAEQVGEETFSCSLGSLLPKSEVLLVFSYVQVVEFKEKELFFSLPKNQENRMESTDRNTRYKSITNELEIVVNLDMTSDIKQVRSAGSEVTFQRGDNHKKGRVTLNPPFDSKNETSFDKFELFVQLENPNIQTVHGEQDPEGNLTIAASFYPDLAEADEAGEVFTELVFLVDCSGSMRSMMDSVRNTLQILLRSLPETCTFNIVDFGTSSRNLWKQSLQYSSKTLEEATVNVSKKNSDLGGTNLLQPMNNILNSKCTTGYSRQLFILTDGQVGNTADCIRAATMNSHSTRIFTFGIGSSVSKELVYGIAEAGNGFCELLDQNNMEEAVMRQLERALKPSVTDLNIEWKNVPKEAQKTPFHIPPLFSDRSLPLFLNLDSKQAQELKGPIEGELTGFIGKARFSQSVKFELSQVQKKEKGEGQFRQLFAKSLIQDLQNGRSFIHKLDGGLISGKSENEVNQIIKKISLSSGILSKLTSFVAVEEREGEASLNAPKSLKIEVSKKSANDSGYGGAGRMRNGSGSSVMKPSSVLRRSEFQGEKKKKEKSKEKSSSISLSTKAASPLKSFLSKSDRSSSPSDSSPRSSSSLSSLSSSLSSSVSPVTSLVSSLIQTQDASGSFSTNSLKLINPKFEEKELDEALNGNSELKLAFVTLVVCLYFENNQASSKVMWNLVVKKAKNWAKKAFEAKKESVTSWEEKASTFLGKLVAK